MDVENNRVDVSASALSNHDLDLTLDAPDDVDEPLRAGLVLLERLDAYKGGARGEREAGDIRIGASGIRTGARTQIT